MRGWGERMRMIRRPEVRALLFFLVVTYGLGAGVARIGFKAGVYDSLVPPPYAPSRQLLYGVWVSVLLLAALAAYLVWMTDDIRGAPALRMYLLQLMLLSAWPWLFFRLEWRLFGFFWGLFLAAMILLTMAEFKILHPAARTLMVPYFIWTLFNVYLNMGFYLLNAPRHLSEAMTARVFGMFSG